MQRFRVSEDSMLPTLAPGDEFVAASSRGPRVGEVVALPHPQKPDTWLVKRFEAGPGAVVNGHRLGPGEAWVVSDNPAAPSIDSRRFGPVPLQSLRPMVVQLDPDTFAEAVDLLAREDPALGAVIDEHGPPPFWQRPSGFGTLVWLIMEQQVSLESGAAMYRRLHGLLGTVAPDTVIAAGEARLRSIGVTRQKAEYLLELATAITTGALNLDSLSQLGPDRARRVLLDVKGIGPWTADAYLLSALRFPDVFPVGDRALQVGAAEVLGLSEPPAPDDLEFISQPWRPLRAVAARVIWHAYLKERGRVEPEDPTIAGIGHTPLAPA